MKNERKERQRIRRSQLSRRIWAQYILSLAAWVFAIVIFVYVAWTACRRITWYGNEFLYPLLHWAQEYIILLCGLAILTGWLVISYLFISRPLRYLDELADAAEKLAYPTDDPIVLPSALDNVADQLNLVRQQALRDNQAAKAAEQRKNDLIVYLAHDLKTPLTSVIGYLTLLRDEPQISQELRARYTGIALEKAERLEDLINEFFDITRFNLSHLELEKQPVDLTRMLQQVASEFQPVFAEKGLKCRLTVPQKMTYDCDPDKLARVFDNLLRNASYYSLPDSTVEISGRLENNSIVLTFTNAAKTIPQEKLDRIFEQFFRLDSSRATKTGGAGLGLAIAKEIVELHGGTIRAESAEEHITFTLCFPLRVTFAA